MDGDVSASVSVGGSVAKPVVSGTVAVKASTVAFERQRMPTLRDVDMALRFDDGRVRIGTMRAEVAGGAVAIEGSVSLADVKNPVFDLRLKAEQALVARDTDLSVRANADLAFAGPLQATRLSGRVGITESRFVRDFEILPVGFLRPSAAPAVRRADFSAPREPGIADGPLAACVLDVRVVTDQPFLVRGNRANADIVADLRITGTGARPVPTGKVEIVKGKAILPFSDLELSESTVTFGETTGFLQPDLNIVGTSEIRSYRIEVKMYGTPMSPKYLLTSDPPLPEEDVVSLIATGTTRSELQDQDEIGRAHV